MRSVASLSFWLRLCQSQVQRLHAAQAAETTEEHEKRMQKEAARVEQLFSKLLLASSTGVDPAVFLDARIAWLRFLLHDRKDVRRALTAFDSVARDAKDKLGPQLASRLERAWKEMTQTSPVDGQVEQQEDAL